MSAPLDQLKILDFSTLLPGPYATLMLADLGADVIRVEAPNRVDMTRILPPFDAHGVAAGHAYLSRNKRNLALNLKKPAGFEIVRRLIVDGGYDIIVEQSRPGVMDRLGVGYAALQAVKKDIIYCSLTGYGQTGPLQARAGHDLNYLALSGMLAQHGRADATPPPLPTQVADIGGGSLHLVIGLLSAVIRRQATGAGGHVDISMLDGAVAWNGLAASSYLVGQQEPAPETLPLNGGTFYDLYETADGRLLSVGSLEPKFWQQFCTAIERPHLIQSGLNLTLANQQAIKAEIRTVIAAKTLAAWSAIFAGYDACVEPVLKLGEALAQPQVAQRKMVVDVPHGKGKQAQIGTPIKLSDFDPVYSHTGTPLGSDTHAILSAVGYSDAEIDALAAQGAVVIHESA